MSTLNADQVRGPTDRDDELDARRLGRGLAVIRVLLGFTFLSNGLAKLFGWHTVEIGPYVGNLINRGDARSSSTPR